MVRGVRIRRGRVRCASWRDIRCGDRPPCERPATIRSERSALHVRHHGAGMKPETVEDVTAALTDRGYLADEGLATAVFLALRLHRPLLLEGEAGTGKTELAKVLAAATGGELIRLQCYEGIDVAQAVYEWDYSRQLLHIRAAESRGATVDAERDLYSESFLVKRPLLRAIAADATVPPVLLVDEVDRADDEFEAFLLEIL